MRLPPLPHIALSLALTLLTGTKPTLSVLHRQPTLYTEPSALPWHWTGYRLWAMPRWVMRYTTRKFILVRLRQPKKPRFFTDIFLYLGHARAHDKFILGFSSDMGSFTKHLQTKRLKDRQLSQQKYMRQFGSRVKCDTLFMLAMITA